MQGIYQSGYLGYKKLGSLKSSVAYAKHTQRQEIDKRIKIIKFFDKHGAETTKEAFGVSRSTVYIWKKKLKESGGKLISLAAGSRTPVKRRKSNRDPQIVEFIKQYRNEHPNTGQEAIKPVLDQYCKKTGINSISVPTIARILKELKNKGEIDDSIVELSYNAEYDKIRNKSKKRRKKVRRKGYKPTVPGDLVQIDSIALFVDGLKRYIITAIDVKSKFAFGFAYESLSSVSALDFMQKLMLVMPFNINRIQTDNGLEFEYLFRDFVAKSNIVHFHNYPRHPQSNAYVERFNRTLQEQCVWRHQALLNNLDSFNTELIKYLLWYNTERRHQSIRAAPMDFFLDNYIHNFKKSNMLRDYTIS